MLKERQNNDFEFEKVRELMEMIVRILDDKLAIDIVVIDVSSLTSICKYFVICSGESNVQLKAMAEEILYQVKHQGKMIPSGVEGFPDSGWILIDYLDVIVHIFNPELREFYRLERLWGQGEFINVREIIGR